LRRAGVATEPAELAAKAHALSGSLFALLDWWIDKGMKADPKEMDALFHRMAWSGVAGMGARPQVSATSAGTTSCVPTLTTRQ
jgi:hypothetical protein